MVRVCYTIVLALLVASCSFFGEKRKDFETTKEEVRLNRDFSDVTTYPLFEACKEQELNDKILQRNCFFEQLSSHINRYLEQERLVASETVQDTLFFRIEVTREGQFNLIDVNHSDSDNNSIKSLKLICNEAVATLPRIDPAQVDGELTTVRFDLPMVLTSN